MSTDEVPFKRTGRTYVVQALVKYHTEQDDYWDALKDFAAYVQREAEQHRVPRGFSVSKEQG